MRGGVVIRLSSSCSWSLIDGFGWETERKGGPPPVFGGELAGQGKFFVREIRGLN